MALTTAVTQDEIAGLRIEKYNARVVQIERAHDDLMVMRIRPDFDLPDFRAGQYAVLGLGEWEPRVAGVEPEPPNAHEPGGLIRRAYSVSCRMLDEHGRLARVVERPDLEFCIALLRRAEHHSPALTPRLFALCQDARIFCQPRFHGHYTLDGIGPDDDIVFAATGTGESPHNAMLAELLSGGHRGRIISVTCVRYQPDLMYLGTHRELERRYPDYRYLTLTTREPENLDPTIQGYVGKRYLQDYFESGDFERDAELDLSPLQTQVFLCGSPDMIGVPHHTHDLSKRYPQPTGMVEILERRGFRVNRSHERGNIHFEKYW